MTEFTTEPSRAPEQGTSSRKRRGLLDFVLMGVGLALVGVFAYQTIRHYRAAPPKDSVPTGEIMAGLTEVDHIPLSSAAARDHNLIIITMDTTRADHLGCYGHPGARTPVIDNLARHGVLYAKAFTTSPSTLPGHSSIMTGLYPYHHGARANGSFSLSEDNITLADILTESGYATAGFISAYVLDSRFGIGQGFETFNDDLSKGVKMGRQNFRERPADFTNEEVFAWLDEKSDSKFFAWIHYFDAHAPYMPPPGFRAQTPMGNYDGEIAFIDVSIGHLLAKLESLGVRDRTLIVLAGDHGEGHGQHGEATHSLLVYDSTLHTPLIFHSPTLFEMGHVVYDQVSNVDIAPTVLSILGIDGGANFDGTSLLRDGPEHADAIYFETIASLVLHGWAPLFGVRHQDLKYIHAPIPELYEVERDPGELENVFSKRASDSARLSQELDAFIGEDRFGTEALSQAVQMDEELAQQMAALGYVGSVKSDEIDLQAAAQRDPKEMIAHWERVSSATDMIFRGNPHEAIGILESCIEEFPGDVYALRGLANAYGTVGRKEDARDTLLRAYEYESNDASICTQLARLYIGLRDLEEARRWIDRAYEIDPEFSGTFLVKGILAGATGKIDEAEANFRQAAEMNPGMMGAQAYTELGFMFLNRLDPDNAREYFERALGLEPNYVQALAGMGSLLADEGKLEEAAAIFARASRFEPNAPSILSNLAGLLDKQGEYDQAKQVAERALQINDELPSALNNMALIVKHQGDLAASMELLKNAVDAEPRFLPARLNLAAGYVALNVEEEAVAQWQAILKINPRVPQALVNLGTYHLGRNRPDLALKLFRQTVAANPDYAQGRSHLGGLLMTRGEHEAALVHLKKSLELDPDQPGHEQIEHQVRMLEQMLPPATQPTETGDTGAGGKP